MYTERIAIREEITQNREEIWKLRERNQHLIRRLSELDSAEKECYDVEGILFGLSQTVKDLTKLFPQIPANVMMNHIAKLNNNDIIHTDNEEKNDKKIVDTDTVIKQKEKDAVIKTNKNKDLKIAATYVLAFLKEKGVPVKSQYIFEHLKNKYNLIWSKQSQGWIIQQMSVHENKIRRVSGMRGYYQI